MHAPGGTRRWLLQPADHERLAAAAARVFGSVTGVIAVYLHGSAARGEPAADLDVAVLAEGRIEPRQLEDLAARLQAEGAPRGPAIDLRLLERAGPRFQFKVVKEGTLLFERDRRKRWAREAQVASRWADFKPTWEKMRQRMLARWRSG